MAEDNDYSITIGATTFTSNTTTTRADDFEITYTENRPSRMVVRVIAPGNAFTANLGDAMSATLKGAGGGLKHFEGEVIEVVRQGDNLLVTAEDQLRKFRYRPITQIFAPNYRRTNLVDIEKADSATGVSKYFSDFRVGTDAVGYSLLDVRYAAPLLTDVEVSAQDNIISGATSADAHIAQAFRAQGHILEGPIDYGISRAAADTAVSVLLRVVTNRRTGTGPAETDPLPSWKSPSNFQHAKMTNGSDAISSTVTAGTFTSKKTTFTFAAPIKTIPGEIYWLIAERASTSDTTAFDAWGKSGTRIIPYRYYASASTGQDHDPSGWLSGGNDNAYIVGMKFRVMEPKTEFSDFEVDETNHRIYWGGTSGFTPDIDDPTTGNATGKCLVRYGYGSELLSFVIRHILQRCGISTYNIAAAVDATYGSSISTIPRPIQLIDKTGVEAMDEIVGDNFAETTKTRRGRWFASSTTGTDTVYVKTENLTTDTAWKTVKDGRDTGAGDVILLSHSLRKMVQRVPTRIIVIGRDSERRPVSGMAENVNLASSVGTTVKMVTDSSVRTDQEAADLAKALIDQEYTESLQGGITIAGWFPEASGYFSIAGNTFNDIIAVSDTDLGIVGQKFRAVEVKVKGKAFTTEITLTQRQRQHGMSGIVEDLEARAIRQEAIDVETDVILHSHDNNATPAGTFAQFEVSGVAVPAWDGQVHRVPVKSLGNDQFLAIWEEEFLDLGGGSEQTNTRDITRMRFYTAYDSGTVEHTVDFTADDKPRFLAGQRVRFHVNQE